MALLRLTVKNIRGRFIRFLLTTIAVVLGVSFVVGTFVITDSLRDTFDDLAQDIGGTIDFQVRSAPLIGDLADAPPVETDLADVLAGVDGVEAVEGSVQEFGVRPLDGNGETLDITFPEIGFSWTENAELAQLFLAEDGVSRAPEDGEFTINTRAADEHGFVVGETYTVELPASGPTPLKLAGVFDFAEKGNDQALAVLTAYPLDFAVDELNGGLGYDVILVDVDGDRLEETRSAMESAISAYGPSAPVEIVTSEQVADENAEDFSEIVTIFQSILLAFAMIILVVSAFIIYNTFTIVIGQRVQELGLLRAIGATGGQVTSTIVGEAFIVGVVSTILGVFGGLGLGALLLRILDAIGFGPESSGAPLRPVTVIVAAIIGIGITVVSALIPALRARRVPPIAALRDGVNLGEYTPQRDIVRALVLLLLAAVLTGVGALGGYAALAFTCLLASVLVFQGGRRIHPLVGRFGVMALGLLLLAIGVLADLDTVTILTLLGVGGILIFVGINLVSPVFAEPVTRLIGSWTLAVLLVAVIGLLTYRAISIANSIGLVSAVIIVPLLAAVAWIVLSTAWAKLGTESRLGTRNAGRSPRRTSSTAAALMIGLALVAMMTVLGSSLKKTVAGTLEDSIAADWFMFAGGGGPGTAGFSHEAVTRLEGLADEGVLESVIGYRFRDDAFAVESVVDSTGDVVYDAATQGCDEPPCDFDTVDAMSARTDILESHLDPNFVDHKPELDGESAIWIHEDSARDRSVSLGDTMIVVFGDSAVEELTVSAIYTDATILGNWTIDQAVFDAHISGDLDDFASAVTADGVEQSDARAAIDEVTADFPSVEVQDREEFRETNESRVDDVVTVVNVLLGLSAVIALIGITNTLTLSVFERTRELGLLRAVGLQRGETRRMVRWEGAIIAVFGGLLGVVVGVLFGWAATIVIPKSVINTLDVPYWQLAQYLVIAGVAGIIASLLPAWRASRLDVLDAIAHE